MRRYALFFSMSVRVIRFCSVRSAEAASHTELCSDSHCLHRKAVKKTRTEGPALLFFSLVQENAAMSAPSGIPPSEARVT